MTSAGCRRVTSDSGGGGRGAVGGGGAGGGGGGGVEVDSNVTTINDGGLRLTARLLGSTHAHLLLLKT